MELRAGYKKTEAGLIPNDWNIFELGEHLGFQGGSQPDKSYFSPSPKEGFIRLIQIRDYKTDKYITYVPRSLARKFCSSDDIMIGRYGPPIFQILKGIEGAYNVALIKAIPEEGIVKSYAYYFLKQTKLFNFVEKLSQRSSGQTGIDLNELKRYPIALPPTKKEQVSIATTLSDVDALITQLEKLITKKRQIKQGAMQTLLNPLDKNGLVKDGWISKKIGSFTSATAGGTPSTSIDSYWGGKVKWMSSGELNNKQIYDVDGRITIEGLNSSATKLIPPKCVLIGLAGQGKTRGTVAINHIELCTNQSIAAIYPNPELLSEFLYFNLDGRYGELRSLSTGDSGRGGLNLTIIKNISLSFPKCRNEQAKITGILLDMDAEISALVNKLEKTKKIKEGMMQSLLTGQIRLADPAPKNAQ